MRAVALAIIIGFTSIEITLKKVHGLYTTPTKNENAIFGVASFLFIIFLILGV